MGQPNSRVMRRSVIAKANEVRLKRQNHKGCFLIVEGRDDRLFFEQFVNRHDCQVTVANGKDGVTDVVRILDYDAVPGVVGVVDADFDHIEGRQKSSDNLIVLETVDLEALLIRSAALDRVLIELGSGEKIAGFGGNVREALVAAAVAIGCLRLHSRRAGLDLTFRGLAYRRFIHTESLVVDVRALVQEVVNRSQRPDLPLRDVARSAFAIQLSVDDHWLVGYGSDMVEILAVGLRKALGTNSAKAVEAKVVRQCLRLAFQRSDLNKTDLSRNLREWAARNPSYRVLT